MSVGAQLGALGAVTASSWLVGEGLLARLAAAGDGRPARRGEAWRRGAPALLLGLLVWHAGLRVLWFLGIPWSRGVGIVAALLLAGVGLLLMARSTALTAQAGFAAPRRPAVGTVWWLLALGAVAVYGGLTWRLRRINPDFIYHWGAKGRRYFEAAGLDGAFLAAPEAWHTHPEYPNLLPELFALVAAVGGGWFEPALVSWSAVWLAALVLATGAALAERARGKAAGAGMVAVAWGAAALGLAQHQAGGADLPLALCVVVGGAALLLSREERRRDPVAAARSDLELGIAAGAAAAFKLEGAVVAALLIGVAVVVAGRGGRSLRGWAMLVTPTAVSVGLWLQLRLSLGLGTTASGGLPRLDNVAPVLDAMAQVLRLPAWHGLYWLVLAAIPLLAVPRVRAPAVVVVALLAFYGAVYLGAPAEAEFWVLSSFGRLLLHVWPLTVLALVLALAPRERASEGASEALEAV